MRLIRRIGAAFKEVPGGQMLGPTPDFSQRLFNLDLIDESPQAFRKIFDCWMREMGDEEVPTACPKSSTSSPRRVSPSPPSQRSAAAGHHPRARSSFPCPLRRPLDHGPGRARLILAMAYWNMIGFGDDHPAIAELRVGYLRRTAAPRHRQDDRGRRSAYDRMRDGLRDLPRRGRAQDHLGLGYGACFGHNELKDIAMSILDRWIQFGNEHGPRQPSEDADSCS